MTAEQIALSLVASPWAGHQPLYVAYCRAHWAPSPEAMLERDRSLWVGGCMCGYMVWISRKWRGWRKIVGMRENDPLLPERHADFDGWLEGVSR